MADHDAIVKIVPVDNHPHYYQDQLKHALAGGTAAVVTRVFVQPLDVLKIRFQLQVEPFSSSYYHRSKYTSLYQASACILREEGVRAFWKGHIPAQLLSVFYGMAQFWGYEILKDKSKEMHWHQRHKNLSNFTCGGLAGALGTFVTTPLDVIRTRLIAQDNRRGYTSMLHAAKTILRSDGVSGLYRGLIPGIMQVTPLTGINFMFYNWLGSTTVEVMKLQSKSNIPAAVALMNGAMAGFLSKIMVYPMDLAKKRMQIQGFAEHRKNYGAHFACNGMIDCFRNTVRQEGFLGLYKGMSPSIYKAALTSALNFGVYDQIRKYTWTE
ncbi:Mitochondrial thiamine pyrophosphate carrier, partial [Pseudolycoriella hygida]